MSLTRTRFTLVGVAALGALVLVAGASAAPPPNDAFVSATAVDGSSLPFSASTQIDEATSEPGEPSICFGPTKSVWYALTPTTTGIVRADTSGSSIFDRIVNVYRQDGSGFGGLAFLGCASTFYNGQSSTTFTAEAGKTYYLQAGATNSFTTGTLVLTLTAVAPPANDDFANATPIASVPFQDDVDTTAATVEAGEPSLCTPPPSEKTAWYSYTPTTSGSVTASIPFTPSPAGLAAYTGSSLAALVQLSCRYGYQVTIHVDAGTTYWFQTGTSGSEGGQLRFALNTPPPPTAGFYPQPVDPSTFDTVSFADTSYDPGNAGLSSETWSFGDGSSVTNPISGCCGGATHRYAADGDYTTTLTVATSDGRTATTSQVIHVRTHDVGIAQFDVPAAASSGKTKEITVGVTDTRYTETVQVQLFESSLGGFQLVGTLVQTIPARGAHRQAPFTFDYTFGADDKTAGKVTFEAVATILGARDAIPGDNTVIALPTKVR